MSILREIRRRARLVVGPVLGISLFGYFAYHMIEGDRGLAAWLSLSQELRQAKATLVSVEAERAKLEHRVNLLRPEHMDRDMLDERARSQLNMAAPNEMVIFDDRGSR